MKLSIVSCMLLGFVSHLYAEIGCFWRPVNGTLWSNAANWNNHDVPDSLKPGATDVYKVYLLDNWNECVLDYDGPTIQNLHLDQYKPLRIVTGGHLTVMDWAILAYSKPGARIVVDGGRLDCNSHLFIGPWSHNKNATFGASVEQNGGIVSVNGVLGPAFYGGRGHYQLNGGELFANGGWDLVNGGGAGSMDIAGGVFIKSGDVTGQVATEVTAGRLTAYGGAGSIVYDYNVTNPGKTTVTAKAPVLGDLDKDFDVDVNDLSLFAPEWLNRSGNSPAEFDGNPGVDWGDFTQFALNWMKGIVTHWHVAQTLYPTDDLIVTPHYAEDFGIIPDGQTDVTEAIQTALISVSNLGGGALFLPAGRYKVSGTLTIPSRVTLRGDWQIPNPDQPVTGTILMAYAGRGSDSGTPFIGLSNCAGVKGLAIWYPEQTPDNILPYPPTLQRIYGSNQTVENITLINAYIGFSNYSSDITASPFLRHIYGTPLKTGIEFDCLADVGRIETVYFSPEFWKNSGLPQAPTANQHAAWIYGNGVGVVLGRIDWSYAAYVTVDGYNRGLQLWPSRRNAADTPNGQCYGFTLKNCQTGIYVEKSSYAGFMFTRFNIQNARTGIYYSSASTDNAALFHSCAIDASGYAVHNAGLQRMLLTSCTVLNGEMRFDGGYASIMNCDFNSPGGVHIRINSGVHGASILGNRFSRNPQIVDNTGYPVIVDHTQLNLAPLPDYQYRKPSRAFTPPRTDLFVVTNPPYHAQGNGQVDDTPAFQAALTDAWNNGGGIVFVPGGDYRLDGALIVPTGVELRGVFDLAHSSSGRGSVLNTWYGRNQENGTPFIQLAPGSGVRGLTIHYPGQVYDSSDTTSYGMAPYPFMIRGLGADVYVINVASTIPWQLLDLATYRCDRHYVDYLFGTAIKTGIHVGHGSVDGQIHNCQFNPSSYAHQASNYQSIPTGDLGGVYQLVWQYGRPYLFGDMTNEVLHQNFVFGGKYGVQLLAENGNGPSGYCMGMGVDQCTTAIQVDKIGARGLDMINSQIVTVNGEIGRYLETGNTLNETFRMFGTCCWGTNNRSVVAGGGDLELQQFHIARDAEDFAYDIRNNTTARVYCGDVTNFVDHYLAIESTAAAAFLGNVINTSSAEMPSNTTNVTSIGNLRVR